jgi:hypothetical protein
MSTFICVFDNWACLVFDGLLYCIGYLSFSTRVVFLCGYVLLVFIYTNVT